MDLWREIQKGLEAIIFGSREEKEKRGNHRYRKGDLDKDGWKGEKIDCQ